MKLTILLCSLLFAAIAAKDSAPEIKRGSGTVTTPSLKNCDALTDRKICKKKDQKLRVARVSRQAAKLHNRQLTAIDNQKLSFFFVGHTVYPLL